MENLTIAFSQKQVKLMRLVVIVATLNAAIQTIIWMLDKKPSPLTHFNISMWAVLTALALAMYFRQRDTPAIELSDEDLTYQQGAFTRSIPLQSITAITYDTKHLIITGEDGRTIKKLKSSMFEDPERLVTAFAALREKPAM
jgi:hypothetical protein